MRQRGSIYVLAAAGIAFVVLGITAYALHQKAKAAEARLETERTRTAQLTDSLKTSEAQTQNLLAENKALDHAVQARVAREKALEAEKRQLRKKLDEIKPTLPPEDQNCLSRPLPPDLASLLDN